MVRGQPAPHDGGMPRLLVLWSRPRHVTSEEAERWARAEIRSLLRADEVRSAELTRLESASARHGAEWSWLLELEVAGPATQFVKRRPCAEWLGDMRLLGMQPRVMVAAESVDLDPRWD
jgi:hypothetical protein